MARLTKIDIERNLLSGNPIAWKDSSKKSHSLLLSDPAERRLFSFLITERIREPTGLPPSFIEGLSAAFGGTHDPAHNITSIGEKSAKGPWRLLAIKTQGFGGLNVWNGPPFSMVLNGESILVEGPNGAGKSSLIGAILWAIYGERPRDQSDMMADQPKEVFGNDGKTVGDWPPIACYPPAAVHLNSPPRVHVSLTLVGPNGATAEVSRTLENGKITAKQTPDLAIPAIFFETGLFMPARLAAMRFNDGKGRLTEAIQKLTGLDDLAAIGSLVAGLCNKSREYLSHNRRECEDMKKEFARFMEEARVVAASVGVSVADFQPAHTTDINGEMARFGKDLSNRATDINKSILIDLAPGLDLGNSSAKNEVISTVASIQAELKLGLDNIPTWKALREIAQILDESTIRKISDAIDNAWARGKEALISSERSKNDSKYQMKAIASKWHKAHKTGPIESCPLCEQDLKAHLPLIEELEALRSAGDSDLHTLQDNLNAIITELDDEIPRIIQTQNSAILNLQPRSSIVKQLRERFVSNERYSKVIVNFGKLFEKGLADSPSEELFPESIERQSVALKRLGEKIAVIERSVKLADWFRMNEGYWSEWWRNLSEGNSMDVADSVDIEGTNQDFVSYLNRLSEALANGEPYRKAAESMRGAWKTGLSINKLMRVIEERERIANSMASLKELGSLAESVARNAIEGLSERIAKMLERNLLTERLKFRSAVLERKTGLSVRAGLNSELNIDASLVANTSWLRAVLWAFIFALREEAVEQCGIDCFPFIAFDDPQVTFDGEHRHRWANYVAYLQEGASKVQVFLATHDEMFLDLIKVSGVTGRQAVITSADEHIGHLGVFEGELLDREWKATLEEKTNSAARDFIKRVREYLEGMLRLMLRGQESGILSPVQGFVVGESCEKIRFLNQRGISPWDRPEFASLVKVLDKNQNSAIKHMEISHHSSASMLGMAEATDVETHWSKKLRPRLEKAFRTAREFHQLHGRLEALHAFPATISLPEGHRQIVKLFPLKVLGRAAALSDGRIADGRVDLEFSSEDGRKVTLAQHLAFRLTSPTLEPVARPGDILLVKESGDPVAGSLVVALFENRIVARRFESADNHSDVAVLTAKSINPLTIASPIIAHKGTLKLYQIVGVLFDEVNWTGNPVSGVEVCECAGGAIITDFASKTLGLVEVVGHSAVPRALNGQYLVIGSSVDAADALKTLVGRPIIAKDTSDGRYFKRLQRPDGGDQIVLESLDGGNEYGPIILTVPGQGKNSLECAWPVLGVLFELP